MPPILMLFPCSGYLKPMCRFVPAFPPLLWQPQPDSESHPLAALMQQQSLTAALKATGATFSVRVLHQGVADSLWADECLPPEAPAFYAREVQLLLNGEAVVWARSVCADSAEGWKQVLDCGTQPLGAQLFGGSLAAERSAFTFAQVPAGWVPDTEVPVWARHSVFVHQGEVLGLMECFLPALARFFR